MRLFLLPLAPTVSPWPRKEESSFAKKMTAGGGHEHGSESSSCAPIYRSSTAALYDVFTLFSSIWCSDVSVSNSFFLRCFWLKLRKRRAHSRRGYYFSPRIYNQRRFVRWWCLCVMCFGQSGNIILLLHCESLSSAAWNLAQSYNNIYHRTRTNKIIIDCNFLLSVSHHVQLLWVTVSFVAQNPKKRVLFLCGMSAPADKEGRIFDSKKARALSSFFFPNTDRTFSLWTSHFRWLKNLHRTQTHNFFFFL